MAVKWGKGVERETGYKVFLGHFFIFRFKLL